MGVPRQVEGASGCASARTQTMRVSITARDRGAASSPVPELARGASCYIPFPELISDLSAIMHFAQGRAGIETRQVDGRTARMVRCKAQMVKMYRYWRPARNLNYVLFGVMQHRVIANSKGHRGCR